MNRLLFLISIGLIFLTRVQTVSAQGPPFRLKSASQLIEKSTQDSIAMIERLSAYYFHGIMNDYRVSKGKKRVLWSDELWLVCLNHNHWMVQQDKLSHTENNTAESSGRDPGDRIEFVNPNTILSWCGENCLYNYDSQGETVEEIAYTIASESFQQWKESPGHNENMIASSARIQGVAFQINGEQVWATELLCTNEFNAVDFSFQKPISHLFKCRDYQTMKALKKNK